MSTAENLSKKIVMQGIHLELTPALQNAIFEKVAVLLRHNDYIVRIHVRLAQDHTLGKANLYRATGQIEIGGPDLIASADGKDAYAVLDELVERLDQLLERRHGKRKDRRNHPKEIELDAGIPKTE